MSDRNKNRRIGIEDIFRYLNKELKGRERNSFERELQKDPFAVEAMEGLDLVSPENALKDVTALQTSLKKRTNRKRRVAFYRIAASIAILAGLSVIFLLTNEKKTVTRIADNTERKEILEIQRSQPLTKPEVNDMVSEEQKPQGKKETTPGQSGSNADNAIKNDIKKFDLAEERNADSITVAKDKSAVAYMERERKTAPASALARERLSVAADEASISQGKSKSEKATERYSPPVPVTGKLEFEKYIRENIQMPDSSISGQTETVIVRFLVRKDGTIDSINAVYSPGKAFTDEAIRLIKTGPGWKPSEKDGIIIEDTVSINIVFR